MKALHFSGLALAVFAFSGTHQDVEECECDTVTYANYGTPAAVDWTYAGDNVPGECHIPPFCWGEVDCHFLGVLTMKNVSGGPVTVKSPEGSTNVVPAPAPGVVSEITWIVDCVSTCNGPPFDTHKVYQTTTGGNGAYFSFTCIGCL